MEVFRLIDDLRSYQLDINSVFITRYEQQPAATQFMNKLCLLYTSWRSR